MPRSAEITAVHRLHGIRDYPRTRILRFVQLIEELSIVTGRGQISFVGCLAQVDFFCTGAARPINLISVSCSLNSRCRVFMGALLVMTVVPPTVSSAGVLLVQLKAVRSRALQRGTVIDWLAGVCSELHMRT